MNTETPDAETPDTEGNDMNPQAQRLAIEIFTAAEGFRQLTEQEPEDVASTPGQVERPDGGRHDRGRHHGGRISVLRLMRYAARTDSVADLEIEAHLRRNVRDRALYTRLLANSSSAWTPVARAASDGQVTSRRIGPHRAELVREGKDSWLVISLGEDHRMPFAIEARGADGAGVRVHLGMPVNGSLSIPLDPAFAELRDLEALFGKPETALFLIRLAENV